MTDQHQDYVDYVEDILNAAEKALAFIEGMDSANPSGIPAPWFFNVITQSTRGLNFRSLPTAFLLHGATAQGVRMPGKIPPITVTKAATASAADTANGQREGCGSCGSFMYMSTTTRR